MSGSVSKSVNEGKVDGREYASENLFISLHAYIHTYKHTYIHTYMHTYIHMYMNTYIHAFMGERER